MSDRESYELLYLNKCGLQVFGYDNFEQVKGKKCYEVLQGRTEPCDFCNNDLLTEDSYYEWERDNEIADGHFLLKDKLVDWDGNRTAGKAGKLLWMLLRAPGRRRSFRRRWIVSRRCWNAFG